MPPCSSSGREPPDVRDLCAFLGLSGWFWGFGGRIVAATYPGSCGHCTVGCVVLRPGHPHHTLAASIVLATFAPRPGALSAAVHECPGCRFPVTVSTLISSLFTDTCARGLDLFSDLQSL